jgi:excisionase family DNA binding protein
MSDSSLEHRTPEQRAFSPDEVATMLGVSRATVSSLLAEGTLRSKKIGDYERIFLSDLEVYLGEERAHSLVCDINADEDDTTITLRSSTSESTASDHSACTDTEFDMEIRTGSDDSYGNRMSRYEPVVQRWDEIDKADEAIVLADLSKSDVLDIRNLLYRRVGKENVIVRTAEQGDGTFKAVVRARKDDEYLRE